MNSSRRSWRLKWIPASVSSPRAIHSRIRPRNAADHAAAERAAPSPGVAENSRDSHAKISLSNEQPDDRLMRHQCGTTRLLSPQEAHGWMGSTPSTGTVVAPLPLKATAASVPVSLGLLEPVAWERRVLIRTEKPNTPAPVYLCILRLSAA